MAASNMNVVVITGNLTRDPELRSTGSGMAVCEHAGRGQLPPQGRAAATGSTSPTTSTSPCLGAQGENCSTYLSKGRPVAVEGRLDWREWEAKDGSGKRQAVSIIANSVQFLGSRDGGGESGGTRFNAQSDVPADTSDFDSPASRRRSAPPTTTSRSKRR